MSGGYPQPGLRTQANGGLKGEIGVDVGMIGDPCSTSQEGWLGSGRGGEWMMSTNIWGFRDPRSKVACLGKQGFEVVVWKRVQECLVLDFDVGSAIYS